MPCWCSYHSIVFVLGTILLTIDPVYLQLPSRNQLLAELKAFQSEQWCIIYPMTSVACAFPLLGVLVALLDPCTVGTTWELLRLLWDARGLSGKHGVCCKSNGWHRELSSPRVLNLVLRLLIHQVPGGCVRWRLGRFVLVNQQYKLNQQIAGTQVYISLLPAYTSILFSIHIQHTTSILNCPDIMWLAQTNASHSNTHPITYTTLYIPSGLRSASCNCIIMLLMPQMWIQF